MAGKRVVVLGGGIGGLIAANRLRRLLNREHRITVVDRSPRHYFPPSFLWLAMGWRRPEDTSRELVRLLRRGVEFVQGEVTAIDVEARKVGVGEGELPFLETGYGKAAMATGNFYAEPKPAVKLRGPGRIWHWAKVLFEKRWLRGWV